MESLDNLNDEILSTTESIQDEHPELTQFLDEMPAPFPSIDDKGISSLDLKGYLNSLNTLLKKYAQHTQTTKL